VILLAGGKAWDVSGEQRGRHVIFGGYQACFAGRSATRFAAVWPIGRLEGSVGVDVHLQVGGDKNGSNMNFGPPPPWRCPRSRRLTIADSATIEGDVDYLGKQEAPIDPKATVIRRDDVRPREPAAKHGRAAAKASPERFRQLSAA